MDADAGNTEVMGITVGALCGVRGGGACIAAGLFLISC